MFIIIVFRLGSDKLICCLFYSLSQGISHGMWLWSMWLLAWGRVDDFSFSIVQFHFFCRLNFIFFISCIVVICHVYYCCIWLGFNTLFCCFFAGFILFSPKGSVTGCNSLQLSVFVILQMYAYPSSFRLLLLWLPM